MFLIITHIRKILIVIYLKIDDTDLSIYIYYPICLVINLQEIAT